jgi:hypothetical protein
MDKPTVTERQALERLFASSITPPWRLVGIIIVSGTVGVFAAVQTIRSLYPKRIPVLVYPTANTVSKPLNSTTKCFRQAEQ